MPSAADQACRRVLPLVLDNGKDINKRHFAEILGPVDLSDVEIIAMDEFALQKGHRYATVIIDPRRKRVLWVGRGRSRQDVRPFFDLLGGDGCTRLRAVAMDMNAAFAQEVKAGCPQAAIVYDLFHVVAFGGARGRRDMPKIVDRYMEKKINIDDLITHVVPLERINEAFELMQDGRSIRSAVTF